RGAGRARARSLGRMSPSRSFPRALGSVADARRYVVGQLPGERDELVAAVEVMTSELATNAVVHAGTPFVVTVSIRGTTVRVDVDDDGAGVPHGRDVAPTSTTGRGLHIVEQLSDSWGFQLQRSGKRVWFAVSRHEPPTSTAATPGSAPVGPTWDNAPMGDG